MHGRATGLHLLLMGMGVRELAPRLVPQLEPAGSAIVMMCRPFAP